MFRPAYLELLASGVLDERVSAAWVHLRFCDLVLDDRSIAQRGLLVRRGQGVHP